jgi:hypothetical protein
MVFSSAAPKKRTLLQILARPIGACSILALTFAVIGPNLLTHEAVASASTGGFEMAFTANTDSLIGFGSVGSTNTRLGVAPGTTPAVAVLPSGGYEVAFQANGGSLYLYSSVTNSGDDLMLGMMAGTSPAIAASPEGGFEVAFEANTGALWEYSSLTNAGSNQSQGMFTSSSPTITALSQGGYEAAFQANTTALIAWGTAGNTNTELGMEPGTSPAIGSSGGGYSVAFEANTTSLWSYSPSSGGINWQQGMWKGTSPGMAGVSNGYEMAFEANTTALIAIGAAGNTNTRLGMEPDTNPSIASSGSGYAVAFEANTTNLWSYSSSSGGTNWAQGMWAGTSPTISAVSPPALGQQIAAVAEYQVGYQDNPVGTFCNAYTAYWGAGDPCGNGNNEEEWCADFAAWVWHQAGAAVIYGYGADQLNGAAASFYQWGLAHGTWHPAGSGYVPQPGDAVVYGLNSAGNYADHVAIVTSYTPGAAGPNVVNGDWWSSSNGGVVAASDETTATGSDGISGYTTPSP